MRLFVILLGLGGYSIQWNNFAITETLDDGCLRPKHVVKGRSDGKSCIVDGIVLCVRDILVQWDA
jgi:hypothetical protein